MGKIYTIATRTSPLALRQVEEVVFALKRFYPEIRTETIRVDTAGDKDRRTPISEMEGTDFFTREIDEVLISGSVDMAVHSAKDLPDDMRSGLAIAALTRSIDPHDALISKSGKVLAELPKRAKIGTSSHRRKEQLSRYRPDLRITDIRGNIEERLELLNDMDLDAVLIAAAGLVRLGLEDRITERLPTEIFEPHPLQGALAVVVREEDKDLAELLAVIDSRFAG